MHKNGLQTKSSPLHKNIIITANIIAYHEAKRIEQCLKSLGDSVDEIILVHDGPCNDNTLDIANAHGARIFIGRHWGEAEPHRPFALRVSRGKWILAIDADERLNPAARRNLRKFVWNASKDNTVGYQFQWPFYYKGKRITKGVLSESYRLALFRKDKFKHSGIPHTWYTPREGTYHDKESTD